MSGAGVGISGLSTGDEGVKLHEGIRTERWRVYLLRWVGGAEFCGEVGEVGKCQLTGIRSFANADIDYFGRDKVARYVNQYETG